MGLSESKEYIVCAYDKRYWHHSISCIRNKAHALKKSFNCNVFPCLSHYGSALCVRISVIAVWSQSCVLSVTEFINEKKKKHKIWITKVVKWLEG